MRYFLFIDLVLVLVFQSCNSNKIEIRSGNLLMKVNKDMETFITVVGDTSAKTLMLDFSASEYVSTTKLDLKKFRIAKIEKKQLQDNTGNGQQIEISGDFSANNYNVRKVFTVTLYDSFPNLLLTKVKYYNLGIQSLFVTNWFNNSYKLLFQGDNPGFWSFQPSSTSERADWVLPIDSGFYRKNFMGMNNSDYGGGTPVSDIWRRDIGLAVGCAENSPKLISLPVEKNKYDNYVQMGVQYEYPKSIEFKYGDSICTYTTLVAVHKGDYFSFLSQYSNLMQAKGLNFKPDEPDAFDAVWCAWGYERKFTLAEVEATLPKVKELGLKWVDIDDGYQEAVGDWNIAQTRFPGGNNGMKELVRKIHTLGLKAKIWWAPLAVHPESELLKKNPDIMLQSSETTPRYITWWNSYYMSPFNSKTQQHTQALVKTFLHDWDFDGLKMDGQHLNCVPPDYSAASNLSNPEESFEKLPDFYKMIYCTATTYKPHAVLQICPCGCAISIFNLPYMNQAVASDPTSSWQIRLKCKTYKALRPGMAYYGDHVELSDSATDFATQIGAGAVLGTKFTWPKDNPNVKTKYVLTPEREKIWKKWIALYNNKMLSRGRYLGELYDIGYDVPETHVIQKSDTLFYAFYNKNWNGEIKLKGLSSGKTYKVQDYENNIDLGVVLSTNPVLKVHFNKHLLIQAFPAK